MPADLHIHSTASDGRWTPGEIVQQAQAIGLGAISLTDHDTVDGIEPARQAAGSGGLEVIPGIELNTDLAGREIHILGYYIDLSSKRLADTLATLRSARENRALMIIDRLARLGIRIDYGHLQRVAGRATIGRPHIAQVMCEEGYVSSVAEAFERYLGNGKSAYIGHHKLDPFMAIEEILNAGGVPVMAHPGLARKDDLIPEFVSHGLQGIEVFYPFHTPEDTARYQQICQADHLIMTGGTDYHGPGYRYPALGTVAVPDQVVEELKRAHHRRHDG
ncbi:MAG: PHP domain-containing protein [Thermacetogeniaceae bacterium]